MDNILPTLSNRAGIHTPIALARTLALFACAHLLSSAPSVNAEACWVDGANFRSFDDGHGFSVADIRATFANPRGPYKMVEDGDVGRALTTVHKNALRAEYPEGKILGTDTGFTFYDVAADPADEAWMSYRVYFSNGFDWTKGGKLPGLCGGPVNGEGRTCPVGCSTVDRYDGFSARLMWRANGAIVAYLYYPDKPKSVRCGEDFVFDTTLESGRWYTIAISVRLNRVSSSGPASNGRVRAWIDGRKTLDVDDIVLRYDDDIKVTRTYLTTYVGGSTEEFAPAHDQYALFDDFASGPGSEIGVCESRDNIGSVRDQSGPTHSTHSTTPTPARIFDFELSDRGIGWSVPLNFANVSIFISESTARPSADSSVFDNARFCYARCAYRPQCASFTVLATECRLHTRAQIDTANPFDYGDGRLMFVGPVSDSTRTRSEPVEIQDQSGPTCGDIGLACCYDAGKTDQAALCGSGDCEPTATTAQIARSGSDVLPCLCSSATCVANLDFCPVGGVCDQSATVPVCGALDQICCAGGSCDEETTFAGKLTSLVCLDGTCAPYI
jgi:hypothetical protein